MKKLLILLLAIVTQTANAGFVTGAIVGSALASSSPTVQGQPSTVFSNTNDVISCVKARWEQKCLSTRDSIDPAVYAKLSGYNFIHHVGVVITPDGREFIVMEVSK